MSALQKQNLAHRLHKIRERLSRKRSMRRSSERRKTDARKKTLPRRRTLWFVLVVQLGVAGLAFAVFPPHAPRTRKVAPEPRGAHGRPGLQRMDQRGARDSADRLSRRQQRWQQRVERLRRLGRLGGIHQRGWRWRVDALSCTARTTDGGGARDGSVPGVFLLVERRVCLGRGTCGRGVLRTMVGVGPRVVAAATLSRTKLRTKRWNTAPGRSHTVSLPAGIEAGMGASAAALKS